MDKNIAAILREDTRTVEVQFFQDSSGLPPRLLSQGLQKSCTA